ncbi:PREDICTED: homeobox protein Hox-B7-like [Thamnophis sirtalis]|uniref:Homeobox protein Hox-B7-like n=1 Tax=Thamnophis sirtalis TaxID=35019 RepID=A0A6I9Z2Q0_9SAUR|nr:PREDICTED: homeobox protein Hox-B7-like [Thamnophis sirtalis]
MSSLYYANALFSKYQAANSVFPSGVFPEQTSCAFASNAQRTGYGSSSTASFAASMPGLYPSGGGMHPQPPGMYSSGYGLDTSSFNMHCSPFEQNLSMMCPGDVSKPNCNKSDQRDTDLRHESNLRIYPWMRSTGGANVATRRTCDLNALRSLPKLLSLGVMKWKKENKPAGPGSNSQESPEAEEDEEE